MKSCVVVPVYKNFNDLEQNEILSLTQGFKILENYDIWFICPISLNISTYTSFAEQKGKKCNVKKFDDFYFKNIKGYNVLIKSLSFFNAFQDYTHMLIYQTDAYVFRDELTYWCKKGYDFIGAPWMEGFTDNTSEKMVGVGNGGFSLHNIQNSIIVLNKVISILSFFKKVDAIVKTPKFNYVKKIVKHIFLVHIHGIKDKRYITKLHHYDEANEDLYWGKFIPSTFSDFKVATVEDAYKFSFEVNPAYLYKLNNYALPFGCHAWTKYDPDFWKNHFEF